MLQFFNTSRIRFDELYQDALEFLEEEYGQSRQVFSIASPFGQLLTVTLSLGRLILYYIEDSITELNIYKANRDESIRGLVRLTGHNPSRANAANGTIKLTYNSKEIDMYGNTLILPNNLKIINEDTGLPYTIIFNNDETRMTLAARSNISANLIQGEYEVQIFQGTGKKLQSFETTVKSNTNIDNQYINIYVNSEKWKIYNSLYDIPYNSKGCLIKTGITSGIDIFFGNTYNGMIPPLGSEIRVEYLKTDGNSGNIRSEETYTFSFEDVGYDIAGNEIDLNEILVATLDTNLSYGSDKEPLFLSRLLAPRTSRNFVLANTTNYIYFFEKFNYFSIIDAFNTYSDNDTENDNEIYLFLVPDINKRIKSNENYFTVPISEFALKADEKTKIYNMIEQSGQKMTSVENKILDPIFRKFVINMHIDIFKGTTKEYVRQKVEDLLSDYFLNLRRRDKIPKSDLIAIIENIDGVDSVNVWFKSEYDEQLKKANPNATNEKINEHGDIEISKNELILIRGDWSDRNGVEYEDSLNPNKPGILNITFKENIKKTYNSEIHQMNLKTLKSSN